jgi:hypothetical protein
MDFFLITAAEYTFQFKSVALKLRPLVFGLLATLCAGLPLLRAAEVDYALGSIKVQNVPCQGGKFVGSLNLEARNADSLQFDRPAGTFHSLVGSEREIDIPADCFMPWKLSGHPAVGTKINVGLVFDIPDELPVGAAELVFRVGKVVSNSWSFARLANPGGDAGTEFHLKTAVAKADGTLFTLPAVIPRLSAPPAIDGKLDLDEWKSALEIPGFVHNGSGVPTEPAALARIGHDDNTLYLAILCAEPAMVKARRTQFEGRDPRAWENESVEVFLCPGEDQASYLHFIVDILNQRYDALGADAHGFNPEWQSAVYVSETNWSAEIALPFASLGVKPAAPGDAWLVNLYRNRYAGGASEASAWNPSGGSFNLTAKFKPVVFDSLARSLTRRCAALPDFEGEIPVKLRARAREFSAGRSKLAARLETMDESAATKACAVTLQEIDALTLEHERISMQVAALKSGMPVAIARTRPYALFAGKPGKSDQSPGAIKTSLLLGENLDLAWNVSNLGDQTVLLRCALRPGTSSDFTRFGCEGLESIWRQAVPVPAGDGRLVCDPLVPVSSGLIRIAPAETAQVWLALRAVLPGIVQGTIEFEVVDGVAREPLCVPLTVEVGKQDMNVCRKFHTFTWNYLAHEGSQREVEWELQHLRDLTNHGVDVFMITALRQLPRVKANAAGEFEKEFDFSALDRLLARTRDLFPYYYLNVDVWEHPGVLREDLIGLEFNSPEYAKAFTTWYRAVIGRMRQDGVAAERIMACPYDESVGERAVRLASLMKEACPEVRIIVDCSTPDLQEAARIDHYTDIWVPHFKQFFPENMAAFHQRLIDSGKPRWVYYYSEGQNEKWQDPTLHYLFKFWWAYKNNLSGLGYWAQQYYGDPWLRCKTTKAYDTSLVYPTAEGPIPSRRWEAWRRGVQDVTLFDLTRRKLTEQNRAGDLGELTQRVDRLVTTPGAEGEADELRAWCRARLAD